MVARLTDVRKGSERVNRHDTMQSWHWGGRGG